MIEFLNKSLAKSSIKLFDTIEHMQADSTAQEGDLAVAYRNEIIVPSPGDTISSIAPPATVVFDTAITGSSSLSVRGSKVFLECSLTPIQFYILDSRRTIPAIIRYTSSDGITYTRTDSGESSYDLREDVIIPPSANPNILKFLTSGGNYFDGFYKYGSYQSKRFVTIGNTKFQIPEQILNYSETVTIPEANFSGLIKFYGGNNINTIIRVLETVDNIEYPDVKNVTKMEVYFGIQTAYALTTHITDEDKDFISFQCARYDYGTYYAGYIYKLTWENNNLSTTVLSPTDIHNLYEELAVQPEGMYNTIYNFGEPSDYNCCIRLTGMSFNTRTIETRGVQNLGTTANTNPPSSINFNVMEQKYLLASSQLNAESDYVYEKIFYGKNGVEIGTLGTVDDTFADITAKIIYEAQQQYDNMTPRVLTDQDKTINTSIRFIPTKFDGTPLFNTSNVTDMSYIFSNCKNLTTIPLLDTSNATTMEEMFSDCSNLVTIPLLDTSNVTDMYKMFTRCTNLIKVPLLDTSNVTRMNTMFVNCTNLTYIPIFDMSNVRYLSNMFQFCPSLSNESLNNIMQMCINAISFTITKTLAYVGLTQEQAITCQSLSNWSAFVDAGWTTGY